MTPLVFHFDLKGLPPTPARFLRLLEIVKALGFGAVLVEWEDAFPWRETLWRSEFPYSNEEIAAFQSRARELGLEWISLQQTLGHLETFLRGPYEKWRENPAMGDTLCPALEGASEWIIGILDEVLAAEKAPKWIHLGGDEAWELGHHPQTRAFLETNSKGALLREFYAPIFKFLSARGVRPILWHDMVCAQDAETLEYFARNCEIATWEYGDEPSESGAFVAARALAQLGAKPWATTWWKIGAHGDIRTKFGVAQSNIEAWLKQSTEWGGFIATSWSRFNTGNPQISPIDGALDSLVFSAHLMRGHELSRAQCEEILRSMDEWLTFEKCHTALESFEQKMQKAWNHLRDWCEHKSVSRVTPRRIDLHGDVWHRGPLRSHLARRSQIEDELKSAFDGLVAPFWIECFVAERFEALEAAWRAAQKEFGVQKEGEN